MTPPESKGALEGLKVLDMTRALAGPFCTMLLADQGAEVAKVETLGVGDNTRGMGPFPPNIEGRLPYGGFFQSVNRNKTSIALDLKSEKGREIIKKLAAGSDVLVENFRSGVMEGLGLSYEVLSAINPRLVYAAIRGFGDPRTGDSPYNKWPAYDVIAQAMGGIMSINGTKDGEPTRVGAGVGDTIPGTLTAFGIMSAVYHANKSGQGQFLDVAMYDAILAFCDNIIPLYSYTGGVAKPQGNMALGLCPFGVFPASNGHVAIACPGDNFWAALCTEMGRPELIDDDLFRSNRRRVRNMDETIDIISNWTMRHTKHELAKRLGGKLPFGPVQDAEDLFNDPHIAARQALSSIEHPGTNKQFHITNTPIKMTKTQGGVYRRAPLLGEHTNKILETIGYSAEQIAELSDNNIIQQA